MALRVVLALGRPRAVAPWARVVTAQMSARRAHSVPADCDSANAKSEGPHCMALDREFHFELGGSIPSATVQWEQWGDPSLPDNRTVFIMPALSSSSHVRSTADNPVKGWWEGVVGPGPEYGVDTTRFRVLSASLVGAPFGSTSPLSTNPRTGKPYGPTFPQVTPADLAKFHRALMLKLGVERPYAVIGASLGGMQALQYAALYPDGLDKVMSICSTGKTAPFTVALRRVQRAAILSDPMFKKGYYDPKKPPATGLAVARELGTICYLSRDLLNQRFSYDPDDEYTHAHELAFDVERYLAEQGRRFRTHYDANCYLLLSRCMDLQDLGRGSDVYAAGALRIKCDTKIVGVDRDMLIPLDEQKHIASILETNGRRVTFETHYSVHGHDAFLQDDAFYAQSIRSFLADNDPHA